MKKTAVVTDSNSGITLARAEKLGTRVVPMPFFIDEKQYLEEIDLSQKQFYKLLDDDVDIFTSQPSPFLVTDLWDELLKEYDEIVYIPMSSSLSGSCDSAKMLAREYDGKVEVVDNRRISVTQESAVSDALAMAKKGMSAAQIREVLERDSAVSSIYIVVDTLKYLKKGGRITPLAAAVGKFLNIKPVLKIDGGKLDAFSKVRGMKSARTVMIRAMKKDFEERFAAEVADKRMRLYVAYSGNADEAREWQKEVAEQFPEFEVGIGALSLSVSCHIGYGSLAIACAAIPEEAK